MEPISFDNLKIAAKQSQLASQLKPTVIAPDENDQMNFKDLLKGLVEQVDSLQKDADQSIRELASGERTDIHNVAIKMEEAGVAFDLMMQIRNKLVEAYKEVSKMQP